MRIFSKLVAIIIITTLYIVGNNQIVKASELGVSHSYITFDKSYTPPSDILDIPDGKQTIVLDNRRSVLPRTGENTTNYLRNIGIFLVLISLIIKYNNKILGDFLK